MSSDMDLPDLSELDNSANPHSSFIAYGTWHRGDRVRVITSVLKTDPLWGVHESLMELANPTGSLVISCPLLAETLDVTLKSVKKIIQQLRDMKLWIYDYDTKTKLLYFQCNPSIFQKFNDAIKEKIGVANWEYLSYKALESRVQCEPTLSEATKYARLRTAMEGLKQGKNQAHPGSQVLVDYLERRDQEANKRFDELLALVKGMLNKEPEAEENAKRHLSLVPNAD